jgi:hypothetical protein
MEKRCYKCGTVKDVSEFYKDSHSKTGLQGVCKECTRAHTKQYQLDHPYYYVEKGKVRYRTIGKFENEQRYEKNREKFLQARRKYGASLVGRLRTLLTSARTRAEKHKLVFDLDFDWLMELYNKQDGKCSLTGIQLQFGFNQDSSRHFMPESPSLDRIDPVVGYTKENTRLVCTAINLAMNHFGERSFEALCKAYLNHRKEYT